MEIMKFCYLCFDRTKDVYPVVDETFMQKFLNFSPGNISVGFFIRRCLCVFVFVSVSACVCACVGMAVTHRIKLYSDTLRCAMQCNVIVFVVWLRPSNYAMMAV